MAPVENDSLIKSTVLGLDTAGREITYSVLFDLPIEIWLLILSKDLNEMDLTNFFNSIPIFKFKTLLDTENKNDNVKYNELWKLIFKNAYKCLEFPNISKTPNDFKLELNTRIKISNSWKHSKGIIHKYNMFYNNFRQNMNTFRGFDEQESGNSGSYSLSDNLIFNYPKVVSYNEGNITLLNVDSTGTHDGVSSRSSSNLKKSARFTYIPCISPSNCSFYKLFKKEIVFGNNDGNLYLKHFEKRSYLNPVTEIFDIVNGIKTAAHSCGISCIEVSNNVPMFSQKAYSNSSHNLNTCQYIVSVDFLGNLKIWFIENKQTNKSYEKVFDLPTVTMCKTAHVFLTESIYKIILLDETDTMHVLQLKEKNDDTSALELINKFKVKLPFSNISNSMSTKNKIHFVKYDYGGNNLILATHEELLVVRFRTLYKSLIRNNLVNNYFLQYKFSELERIQNITIDEETSKEQQCYDLLGKDGCLINIVTEFRNSDHSSNAYVFNIRNEENMNPQTVINFDEKCYATCINKILLMVYMSGRLSLYNALSGEKLKTIKISTSPQCKKNPANDFNMIKTSKDKIVLYGVYNSDLHFINYNVENVQKAVENSHKKSTNKEKSKNEQFEDLRSSGSSKKKGGYVKANNEGHIDSETIYEYYENKQQDLLNKKKFENFDIDLNKVDGLNLEELDDYEDDELIQLKIALSESLSTEKNDNSEDVTVENGQFKEQDMFANTLQSKLQLSNEDMTEEEQLAFALSLSMKEM